MRPIHSSSWGGEGQKKSQDSFGANSVTRAENSFRQFRQAPRRAGLRSIARLDFLLLSMSQTLRIHYSFTIDYLIDLECDEIHSNHLIGPPRWKPADLITLRWLAEFSLGKLGQWDHRRSFQNRIVTRPTSTSRRATEHCFNHKAGSQKIGPLV
jgi:hypothetical protein